MEAAASCLFLASLVFGDNFQQPQQSSSESTLGDNTEGNIEDSSSNIAYDTAMFFHFVYKKTLRENFSHRMSAKWCCKRLLRARILAQNSHTSWLLIGGVIFVACEKPSFAILIGRIIFFTCENHRLRL